METVKVILNLFVLIVLPIAMFWFAISVRNERKQLEKIAKEFNDMITEAVNVRDEIQSLFDEFEGKLDAENEANGIKIHDVYGGDGVTRKMTQEEIDDDPSIFRRVVPIIMEELNTEPISDDKRLRIED